LKKELVQFPGVFDVKDNFNIGKEEISIKNLSDKKLIAKKYGKLKILGKGEVKEKIKIKTDFISKSAKVKIEKIGGSINIVKEKTP